MKTDDSIGLEAIFQNSDMLRMIPMPDMELEDIPRTWKFVQKL